MRKKAEQECLENELDLPLFNFGRIARIDLRPNEARQENERNLHYEDVYRRALRLDNLTILLYVVSDVMSGTRLKICGDAQLDEHSFVEEGHAVGEPFLALVGLT